MTEKQTVVRKLKVLNQYGIHARPAALLVKTAGKFTCEIFIGRDSIEVSAKSIMGLLTIEGYQGTTLKVRAVGSDALEAITEIEELFKNQFFED